MPRPSTLRVIDGVAPSAPRGPLRVPLGERLVTSGHLTAEALSWALELQKRRNLRLGDILLAHDMVPEPVLTEALAVQFGAQPITDDALRPDPRLIEEIGLRRCLEMSILPLARWGGATLIATSDPEGFATARAALPDSFGPPVMAICSDRALREALLGARDRTHARRAETRVAEGESCRYWYAPGPRNALAAAGAALVALLLVWPAGLMTFLAVLAVVSLLASSALKTAAILAALRVQPKTERDEVAPARLPVVSIMVPLFREEDIVGRLIERLDRSDYPRELLDICLVCEEDDTLTRTMLASARLPYWTRVITVPRGPVQTKPRALNFALDFCRGSIIGIYDAEDAPEPDQISRVVTRFLAAPPDVVCLQGVLDFYNSRRNWLSRCFTVEYAGWFRLILPGLARLGLVVPLGGTTLFFRREALEKLGGWDAHNVTEDADLGLRLARYGYRTELIDSTTFEEANCRTLPWVRQRSRWLKGYAMTWATHMRNPAQLWRDLGPRRFIGVQVLFLGTLVQFLLTPILWSFWLIVLGLPHPMATVLPPGLGLLAAVVFMATEALTIATGILGVRAAGKRWLWAWVPTLHVYYPLAALAGYKAIYEMVARPFYWDKTSHGAHHEEEDHSHLPPEAVAQAAAK